MKSLDNDQTIDAATKAKITRAAGAQANGFENLPLFAAAVVAGNAARLDVGTLNGLCVGYLVSRVAYNLIYINQTTNFLGEFVCSLDFWLWFERGGGF